jgi:predicted deacylase
MQFFSNKKIIAAALMVLVCGAGLVLYFLKQQELYVAPIVEEENTDPVFEKPTTTYSVIGTSVEGRAIEVYTYGTGDTQLLFVGGIHGGYEWNSVFLAYRFMDYIAANPDVIPSNITVAVIPSANPDGVFEVIGKEGRFTVADTPAVVDTTGLGRFNANDVDLNRNFACKWQQESMWRGEVVSAGTEAFSEPEAAAIRDYVLTNKPTAVVFWHSQSSAVYASECEAGVLPETLDIMTAYSNASGYTPIPKFDAYEITGDAEGWLASQGIPAITVELKTHETIEWDKNLAGVKALFDYYNTELGL